ncbi:MAG: molybdate ABC transporter permease subunit [Sandaracinaceae bacterium]|nr:molybdate ABC transporter permease subunit [Myxococcales bacterium]MCB9656462.1 molybdate ABC transporter permease subunit [Sandaracinaceae bacterium]
MSPRTLHAQRVGLGLLGGALIVFLLLPLVALVLGTPPRDLSAGLRHPLVWPALRLSLLTTSVSLALTTALGTPLAWMLARADSRASRALESALQLPIVIPPSVAGVAMLFAFGRRGLLAGWLYPAGWSVAFTTGAVVLAQVFVSAPFYVQAAVSAFRRVDERVLAVARTLGATPLRVFSRVAVPLALRGLVAGAALAWARALGEFGATLMFAGNLEGRTQTLPLAIYGALETDMRAAQALSVVLVVVSLLLLLGVRGVLQRVEEHRRSGR